LKKATLNINFGFDLLEIQFFQRKNLKRIKNVCLLLVLWMFSISALAQFINSNIDRIQHATLPVKAFLTSNILNNRVD